MSTQEKKIVEAPRLSISDGVFGISYNAENVSDIDKGRILDRLLLFSEAFDSFLKVIKIFKEEYQNPKRGSDELVLLFLDTREEEGKKYAERFIKSGFARIFPGYEAGFAFKEYMRVFLGNAEPEAAMPLEQNKEDKFLIVYHEGVFDTFILDI